MQYLMLMKENDLIRSCVIVKILQTIKRVLKKQTLVISDANKVKLTQFKLLVWLINHLQTKNISVTDYHKIVK